MKPFFTLLALIAVLISSCSKETPEPEFPKTELEIKSDEIRAEYSDRLPELRDFPVILQDYNAVRDYLIVYGSNDTKIFVAYLDQNDKTVKYKKIIDAPAELSSKFQVQRLGISAGNQEENHSASIFLRQKINDDLDGIEREAKSIGAVILFLNERELSHVSVARDASFESPLYFSEVRFTHNMLYYCISETVYMLDKVTLRLLYSGPVVERVLTEEPIRSYYIENDRAVVLYRQGQGKLIVECGEISDSNFKTLWKHELPDWHPVEGETKRSDYTFWDDQGMVFLQYVSSGNRYENGVLVKYSEKELYQYDKVTGK